MEIYVQVYSASDDNYAWYSDDRGEQYLTAGKELWCTDSPYGEYPRGTAFKSVKKAKAAGKKAKELASWEGIADAKVQYWKVSGGKLVKTKFVPANKKPGTKAAI